MSEDSKSTGRCFCGDVEFTLNGEAEAMAYCHCDSCRQWSAGPVSAFTLWKPANIKITKGADKLGGFSKNPLTGDDAIVSNRVWCKTCGGHVYTDHPAMGLVDIPAVIIKNFAFKPGFHVHYQESVFPVKDGLLKFKDLPKEAGGSGIEVPE